MQSGVIDPRGVNKAASQEGKHKTERQPTSCTMDADGSDVGTRAVYCAEDQLDPRCTTGWSGARDCV